MKKILIAALAACLIAIPALSSNVGITIGFDYTGAAQDYVLYLNGQEVCRAGTGEVAPFVCNDVEVEYGANLFTLTAIDMEGDETTHSSPYKWTYEKTPGESPTFLSIKVEINGETLELVK